MSHRLIITFLLSMLMFYSWAPRTDCKCLSAPVETLMCCCKQATADHAACCERMYPVKFVTTECSCSSRIPQDRLQSAYTLKLTSDKPLTLIGAAYKFDNKSLLLTGNQEYAIPNVGLRPREKIFLEHRALLI
jgi:hypothetical protein